MSESKKVLIVDDNEINGMLAAEMLKAFGVESDIASSGEESIEKVKEETYAIILMDQVMPGMNGVTATGLIKQLVDVPVYAMTGDLTDEVRTEFEKVGACGFIHKPLKPAEMFEVIKAVFSEEEYSLSDEAKAMLAPAPENAGGETALRRIMSKVTDLDYESGMSNSMNKEENYLRLLKAAAVNIRQYTSMLSEYLASADPESLKLASHSLKTVFANIGIEKLRIESEKIELRAHKLITEAQETGAIPNFSEEHQNLISDYISNTMTAALELEGALEEYEAENPVNQAFYDEPESPLADEDIKAAVEYTQAAFDRFEIDYIFEGLEYLKKAFTHDARKKIEAAIDATSGFMYEDALRLFKEATEA